MTAGKAIQDEASGIERGARVCVTASCEAFGVPTDHASCSECGGTTQARARTGAQVSEVTTVGPSVGKATAPRSVGPGTPQVDPALSAVTAVVALIVAWFLENAAIHAMGYSGFAGAGWITAIVIPVGAAGWAWDLPSKLARANRSSTIAARTQRSVYTPRTDGRSSPSAQEEPSSAANSRSEANTRRVCVKASCSAHGLPTPLSVCDVCGEVTQTR